MNLGTIVLYICLAGVMLTSLARPWIGVIAAYLFVVLGPQYIWWWAFEGARPVLWTLVPALIGIVALLLQGQVNLARLKTRQSLFLFILWICFLISSFAGPYVNVDSPYRWFTVHFVRTLINNIFLLYFAAVLLIDTQKKLWYVAGILIISTIYLTYWINDQYLFQGAIGRIGGPSDLYGNNIYGDENTFAMLFVVGLPFLYYFGLFYKRMIIRYGLWLVIPLGWHAIFLTGSRGGLVGLALTTMMIVLRSPRKIVGVCFILALVVAYQWEAGSVLKSRADIISDYEEDQSVESRITSWKAAIGMISDHYLCGVGITSFGVAYPDYSTEKPHEAHNTFFQIAAEAGLIAGIMYLLVVFTTVVDLWKISNEFRRKNAIYPGNFLYCFNEALLTSFIGLVVCSLFLSLQVYEIFYFFCVSATVMVLLNRQEAAQPAFAYEDV